jgi:hypothetical protein
LGRFLADRLSTPIWWPRAKFSSSREAGEQNIEDRVARSVVERNGYPRRIFQECIVLIGSRILSFSRGTGTGSPPHGGFRRIAA